MNKLLGLHPSLPTLVALLLSTLAQADPAAVLAFSGIKPGDKVAQFLPDTEEMTRLLCTAVGETGHVYVITLPGITAPDASICSNLSTIILQAKNVPAPELHSTDDDPGAVYEYWSNRPAAENFAAPELLDVILIADHYQALPTRAFGAPRMDHVNKALLQALQLGGVLIITIETPTKAVQQQLIAAGFIFERQSKLRDKAKANHSLLRFRH
jgi:predicted methyltransferase